MFLSKHATCVSWMFCTYTYTTASLDILATSKVYDDLPPCDTLECWWRVSMGSP